MSRRPVAVVGAGAMGRGIAEVVISAGQSAILYNRNEKTLAAALDDVARSFERKVAKGRLDAGESERLLALLTGTTELPSLADASLVIETIAEDPEAKHDILEAIEAVVGSDAIIATNTSSLSINGLSSRLKRPQRFLGLHFFNPAPRMALVEVIPGHLTSPAVTEESLALVRAWGKKTVVCKSTPGFIVNRVARPFYVEAFRLLDEGFQAPDCIDRALKAAGGFRMGPFELTDLIGQDVNFQVTSQIWQSMGYDPKYTPSLYQRSLVDSGLLGRKRGQGVYRYGNAGAEGDAKGTDARQVPPPREPFPGRITVHGDLGVLAPLAEEAARNGVAVEYQPATAELRACITLDDGTVLRLTDGRPAAEVAAETGRDVIVVDLALSYERPDLLLVAANEDIRPESMAAAAAFLGTCVGEVAFIDDTPGLVVARIVSCLINEAVLLVQQKVCTRADIETAAKLGVNYPLGLLEWMDRLGSRWVAQMMRNLSAQLHPTRYRSTPAIGRVREPSLVG